MIIRPLAAAFLLLAPLSASAVSTYTWDGGAGTANFSDGNNWNPNGVPASGDTLIFPAAAPDTVTNDLPGLTFGALSFTSGTTLAGNAFTLTGGISVTSTGVRSAVTIDANVTLGADQTFTSGGTGSLRFTGNVAFGSRVLTVTGTRTTTFDAITGSTTPGSRLIKSGTGMVRFSETAIGFLNLPLDLTAGTLDVDGILQAAVNMTAGKLTGEGNILGLTATAGDIEPDASDLQVSGSATLGGTSRCLFHLTGAGAENTLECTGSSVTIQEEATMVVDAVGYTPVWDEDFQLLSKSTTGAITGTFSNAGDNDEVPLGSTVGRAHYNGGNGNDLTLDIFSTTRQWDGGNTLNDNWDEAENWTQNTRPNFGDVLDFPPGIQSTDRGLDNNFPNDTTFRQLVFRGDDYTVRGNRFKLSHGINLAAGVTANMDTSVVLARDQTWVFGNGGTLHFDLLDEIETAGRILTLNGPAGPNDSATLDGAIAGTGKVVVAAGSRMVFKANSSYSGETTIEAGAELLIDNRQEGLGVPGNGTIVHGELIFDLQTLNPTEFNLDEPLVMMPGSIVRIRDSGSLDSNLRGGLELRGAGDMTLSDNGHGDIKVPTAIHGAGNLVVNVFKTTLEGNTANSYSGSTRVKGGTLFLSKSAPAVNAIPSAQLQIGPSNSFAIVETQQDEQILDTSHVTVVQNGKLRIGNVTRRTETIGSLTLADEAEVEGPDNSLLIVRGNVTKTNPGAAAVVSLDLRLEASPCLFQIDQGSLQFTSGVQITRSGNANIRKTGPGLLIMGFSVAVPIEIAAGTMQFSGSTTFPITLNGGVLSGTGGTNGGIIGLPGGGIVSPGDIFSQTRIFNTASVTWIPQTSFRVDITNATAGSGHDRLVALGTVTLGNATLQLVEQPGFNVPVGGQVFPLLNDGTDATGGTFAGLPEGAFIPASTNGWRISYIGGDGNDVMLTRVVTPPTEVQPVVTSVTFGNPDVNGNRSVAIAGKGTPGASYLLENSVNLSQWTPEGTPQTAAAVTGIMSFSTTASPPVRLKQFWRIRRL